MEIRFWVHNDAVRAVIDTNVLVEGLKRKGTCGAIVDHWVSGKFTVCVSTALALEYEAVLTRHGSPNRIEVTRQALQALLCRADFVPILETRLRKSGLYSTRRESSSRRWKRRGVHGHTDG